MYMASEKRWKAEVMLEGKRDAWEGSLSRDSALGPNSVGVVVLTEFPMTHAHERRSSESSCRGHAGGSPVTYPPRVAGEESDEN